MVRPSKILTRLFRCLPGQLVYVFATRDGQLILERQIGQYGTQIIIESGQTKTSHGLSSMDLLQLCVMETN